MSAFVPDWAYVDIVCVLLPTKTTTHKFKSRILDSNMKYVVCIGWSVKAKKTHFKENEIDMNIHTEFHQPLAGLTESWQENVGKNMEGSKFYMENTQRK